MCSDFAAGDAKAAAQSAQSVENPACPVAGGGGGQMVAARVLSCCER